MGDLEDLIFRLRDKTLVRDLELFVYSAFAEMPSAHITMMDSHPPLFCALTG